jgi:hypothetical protein
MGFLWTFLWIVVYRDFNPLIVNGDEEAFIPSASKVLFQFEQISEGSSNFFY